MRTALLVLLMLTFASPLYAISLNGAGSLMTLSDAWGQRRLIGSSTSSIGPPSGLSKSEKAEWTIGVIVASSEMCGYYSKAADVRAFMKPSPHFQKALSQMNRFHFAKGCGKYEGYLDEILDGKNYWEQQVKSAYVERPTDDLLSRAEQGDAEAHYILGQNYRDGKNVKMSVAEARRWYLKAAESGHSKAQYEIGYFYERGRSVDKDLHEACYWYRKAAAQGNARAQYKVGLFYEQGWVTQKDLEAAQNWYWKAALQRHAFAGVSFRRLQEMAKE